MTVIENVYDYIRFLTNDVLLMVIVQRLKDWEVRRRTGTEVRDGS